MDFEKELQALVSKYGESIDNKEMRRKMMESMKPPKKSVTKTELETEFGQILDKYANMNLPIARYRKALATAWAKRHTDDDNDGRKGKIGPYQQYVKDKLPVIVKEFPDMNHRDRMKLLATRWKEQKDVMKKRR